MYLYKRGGSWYNNYYITCKVNFKNYESARQRGNSIGFRLCFGGVL
jgi:formylglycine-generating enzyme required for sulfatase activity